MFVGRSQLRAPNSELSARSSSFGPGRRSRSVSHEQGRRMRVERVAGFQMDEVGVLLEVAPSGAIERAARAAPFPNALGLVPPAAARFGHAICARAGGRPMRRRGEVATRRIDVVVEQIGLDDALVRERRELLVRADRACRVPCDRAQRRCRVARRYPRARSASAPDRRAAGCASSPSRQLQSAPRKLFTVLR
jgi:hypothetical protein